VGQFNYYLEEIHSDLKKLKIHKHMGFKKSTSHKSHIFIHISQILISDINQFTLPVYLTELIKQPKSKNMKNIKMIFTDKEKNSKYNRFITAREMEIMNLMNKGFSFEEISKIVSVNKKEIDKYQSEIFKKMEIKRKMSNKSISNS
jgi:DNA-binding NarL/FixJ family response regulator